MCVVRLNVIFSCLLIFSQTVWKFSQISVLPNSVPQRFGFLSKMLFYQLRLPLINLYHIVPYLTSPWNALHSFIMSQRLLFVLYLCYLLSTFQIYTKFHSMEKILWNFYWCWLISVFLEISILYETVMHGKPMYITRH